jgi:hypothetical protein
MLKHFEDNRNDYNEQLRCIEGAFISERTEILHKNDEEIKFLF